jgi:hypothetical protein
LLLNAFFDYIPPRGILGLRDLTNIALSQKRLPCLKKVGQSLAMSDRHD